MAVKATTFLQNKSELRKGVVDESFEDEFYEAGRRLTLRQLVPIRKRKILKKSLGRIVILAIPSLIALVLYFAGLDALRSGENGAPGDYILAKETVLTSVVVGFFSVLVFYNPFWEALYFVTYHYDMDEKNVVIRKGVIAKREITLPFAKITDVYVDRDILDVIFSLYDVHISTPTVESGKFAHIDGVDRAGAKKLRQLILDRVNVEED